MAATNLTLKAGSIAIAVLGLMYGLSAVGVFAIPSNVTAVLVFSTLTLIMLTIETFFEGKFDWRDSRNMIEVIFIFLGAIVTLSGFINLPSIVPSVMAGLINPIVAATGVIMVVNSVLLISEVLTNLFD